MFVKSVNFAQRNMDCGSVATSKPYLWRKDGIKQGNYVFASAAYQAPIEVKPAGEPDVVLLTGVVPTTIACCTAGHRKGYLQESQ